MEKKLRLLLNKDCNRNCPGCCNKDWDVENLLVCHDYTPYGLIMLTGGEPMMHPDNIIKVVNEIRKQNETAKIVLYTAKVEGLAYIMTYLDGVTLTLHTEKDVMPFQEFEREVFVKTTKDMSLRLNVFEGIHGPDKWQENLNHDWKIKNNIHWIKNCPLPENEVFMQWEYRTT